MNLSALRDAVWAHLGTTSSDRAFPPAKLTRWLNDVRNELILELPGGYRQTSATWTPDGGTGRVYTLATQSAPVTALVRVLTLRLVDADGSRLTEVRFDQREEWVGLVYAITGADESAVLHTSSEVESGVSLYAEYEAWPAELAADNDTPSEIPARFHDVLALMAAELAFSSGGEGRFPERLAAKLYDRRAQLWAHAGRRSLDVSRQRETSATLS